MMEHYNGTTSTIHRKEKNKENDCRNTIDEVDSIAHLKKQLPNGNGLTTPACIECNKNQQYDASGIVSSKPKKVVTSNGTIITNGNCGASIIDNNHHSINNNITTTTKTNGSTNQSFSLLRFNGRKLSDPSSDKTPHNNHKKSSLVKSITIARLFGNTYDTKQPILDKLKKTPHKSGSTGRSGSSSGFGSTRSYQEKFLKTDSDFVSDLLLNFADGEGQTNVTGASNAPGGVNGVNGLPPNVKPFRTLSRSVGKLLRRNYSSVDISDPDPEYKVSYLGNVLTAWAKGTCVIVIDRLVNLLFVLMR